MSQLLTLQATRGIAANLVVFSHLFLVEAKYTAAGVLPAFALYGMAGVDVFFVLSGFIMVAVAGRNIGPMQFSVAARCTDLSDILAGLVSGARRRDCGTSYGKLVRRCSDLAVAIVLASSRRDCAVTRSRLDACS